MIKATHGVAVYIARALNLDIENVWDVINGLTYTSYEELEEIVLDTIRGVDI